MPSRVGIALLLVIALAVGPAGTAMGTASAEVEAVEGTSDGPAPDALSATSGEDTLTRTTTFSLQPDDPGTIRAEMAFSIPDQVVELTTAVPTNAHVVGRDGFQAAGNGNYTWDEQTSTPSITLSVQVNRTGNYHQRPTAAGDPGLVYVDTGSWAIASVPSAAVWWSSLRSEPPVTFARETAVAGEGVAGDRMVYLGGHDSLTRTVDGQTITLVVPERAMLEPSRAAIFDTLARAGTGLPSSPVTESLLIAAPTGVDWGPYGLTDGSDAWVRADQRLDTSSNVWVHEFVHLRQDFRTTADTRWLREGMPEYYAALFTLEAGHVDFDQFRTQLDRGTRDRYADVVLSDPGTWTGLAQYAKGALVYGDLDRRIRLASDGGAAALQVFAAMNEQESPIDQAFLTAQIEAVSDDDTARAFADATTSTATPTPWSVETHREAFGTAPPKVTAAVGDAVRVTGPYRNVTTTTLPTLVPGERLTIPVSVRNDGEAPGDFELDLEAKGAIVDAANGTLAGGETVTVELSHRFSRANEVALNVAGTRWTVTVSEPSKPVAAGLSVGRTSVRVGDSVQVTVEFDNPERVPADGTGVLTVDGAETVSWPLRLDAGETQVRTTEVTIAAAGPHQIAVGNQSVTVQGLAAGTSTASTDRTAGGTTATSTPGFGRLGAGTAVLLVAFLFVARRQ
jgi:hypothetical protein